MTQVTVRLYKQGDKVWRDFKAELIKRYENSAMLDISKSKAFSKIEKQEFKLRRHTNDEKRVQTICKQVLHKKCVRRPSNENRSRH